MNKIWTSSPSGTPECCWNTRRAVTVNEAPGAPQEVEVEDFVMRAVEEGVPPPPPPLTLAQVAELVR